MSIQKMKTNNQTNLLEYLPVFNVCTSFFIIFKNPLPIFYSNKHFFSFLILRVKRGVEFPPFHKFYAPTQTFGVLGEFFVKCLTLVFNLRAYF